MRRIIDKLVKVCTKCTTSTSSTSQESMEEGVNLATWVLVRKDLPSMDYVTQPEVREKCTCRSVCILCTKRICAWCKSLCGREEDQQVAEDERRRKLQEAEAERRKLQEAEEERRKLQEAEEERWKLQEEEEERRKLQEAEEEREKERQREQAAIKVQTWFRKWRAQWNFKILMREENPPLRVIAHFARLMDPIDATFIQELQLNKLKGEVVSKMKATQEQALELSKIEEDMSDVVQAKSCLQDLVSGFRKLTEKTADLIKDEIEQRRIQEAEYKRMRRRRREETEPSPDVSPLQVECSLQEDLDSEMENLLTVTKKLLLDVLRVQPGETLREVLSTCASQAKDDKHCMLMKDSSSTGMNVLEKVTQSQIMDDHRLSLEMKKQKVQTNLETLHKAGRVTVTKGYNTILANIAKDIRMKHKLRQERKDEMEELRKTSLQLNVRSKDLQERIPTYKEYREVCVKNFFWAEMVQRHGKLQNMKKIQYTARELQKRGVIVGAYEDKKQLKREVLTLEPAGANVRVHLGTESELLPLLDLLKLFAESSNPTMKIFHYEVNTSLLLFLVCSKIFRVW